MFNNTGDNMQEDTVQPQEEIVTEVQQDAVTEMAQDDSTVELETQKQVPLSALQEERKRRQEERKRREELELELQWERNRQRQPVAPVEEDTSKYESATREDLVRSQEEIVRIVEEKSWIKNNPEKYEKLNEYLPQFLKQRPNLAAAINSATNRYEEAYTLMEALTPKQQQQLKTVASPKKEAPNAPGGVPKAAALNQVTDVMSMSDSEFVNWRNAQKKRR